MNLELCSPTNLAINGACLRHHPGISRKSRCTPRQRWNQDLVQERRKHILTWGFYPFEGRTVMYSELSGHVQKYGPKKLSTNHLLHANSNDWRVGLKHRSRAKKSHGTRAWPSQGITNFRKWEHLKFHEAHGVLGGSSHLVIKWVSSPQLFALEM